MSDNQTQTLNAFLTLPKAAEALGIPVSTLRRAANKGLFPTYQIFNARKRILLSEVIAAMDAFNNGEQDHG